MTLLDQAGDLGNRTLHTYLQLYSVPEYVKKSDIADIVGENEKRAASYADVRMPHQFPTHTAAATWVSHMFYLNKEAEIHPKARPMILERLAKKAAYWGIKNAIDTLTLEHKGINKAADAPDSHYALVWSTKEGKQRQYRLANGLEIKAAAAWFVESNDDIRRQFSFYDRHTIASKILKRATDVGAAIKEYQDELEMAAGKGMCNPKQAAAHVRNRAIVAARVGPIVAEGINKLADCVEAQPKSFMDPNALYKLASTLDEFDRQHNLIGSYNDSMPSPESVCFNMTFTKMSQLHDESCQTLTGTIYTRDQFSKVSRSDFNDLFGDELASQVCTGLKVDPNKMADIIPTLPLGDAQTFDRLMEDMGQQPLAKEARHEGFTTQQLAEMAALQI
jgi:hypothetical protein